LREDGDVKWGAGGRRRAVRREKLSRRWRKPAIEAGFFALGDRVWQRRREEFAAWGGHKRKRTIAELKFHGARPLGASGESRVSGPPQWGQLRNAKDSVVFTAWLFGFLEVAESRCLAF